MIPAEKRKKFDIKAVECIFIGHADQQKGYRFYNKKTKKIVINRDAFFFENEENVNGTDRDLMFFKSISITDSDDGLIEESKKSSNNSSLDTSVNSTNNNSSVDLSAISSNDSTS